MNEGQEQQDNSGMQALMKLGIFWVLFMAAIAFFFNDWNEKKHNPNQSINQTSSGELALKRNAYGHYVTSGLINGEDVVLMLDTGASSVVIPQELADRLNLHKGNRGQAYTANGPVTTYSTMLKRLEIGNIVLTNVPASINMGDQESDILLGMSVLGQLDFRQSDGYLYLKPER